MKKIFNKPSLKVNIHKYRIALIVGILILIYLAIGLQYFKEYGKDGQTRSELKELVYERLSPDQSKKTIVYDMKFDPSLYKDYYAEYFLNNLIISVRELEYGQERYIFTGESYGSYPRWLGNEHVFFTYRCGTSCQGVYLINTNTKETRTGLLGYVSSSENDMWVTHFIDWFDQEFQFDWFVDEMYSEIINKKTYLIFRLKDDNSDYVGEKRFIFTGNELLEVN